MHLFAEQEADGKGDPTPAADDTGGEHAEVAQRIEGPGETAHGAGHQHRQKPDAVHIQAGHVHRLRIFTGGADGKTQGGLEEDEIGHWDHQIGEVGQKILLEEHRPQYRNGREQGDGNGLQHVDLQGGGGDAEEHPLEEGAEAACQDVDGGTGNDLLLLHVDGNETVQGGHKGAAHNGQQNPCGQAAGDVGSHKAAPGAQQENALDGGDHHAGSLGVDLRNRPQQKRGAHHDGPGKNVGHFCAPAFLRRCFSRRLWT